MVRGLEGNGRIRTRRMGKSLAAVVLAVTCAWLYTSSPLLRMLERQSTQTVNLSADETGTHEEKRREDPAPLATELTATAVAPVWDPPGCQTLVFFHVPKTGGESLNALWTRSDVSGLRQLPWWEKGFSGRIPLRVTGLEQTEQERFLKSIKPWLRTTRVGRHKIIEIHCGDALSFMQAREALTAMREAHAEHDCGFFAFTVIRPPLDWLVSLYDDICHRRLRGHKDTCPQKEGMTPKEEMLAFPHRDGIVSYLTHGFKGWASPGPVDEATVEELVASLRSHLDLVAFTSEISQLRKYLTARFTAPDGKLTPEVEEALDQAAVQNANDVKTIRVTDFEPEELNQLNSTIQLDWKLYEAVLAEHRAIDW